MPSGNSNAASNATNTSGSPSINAPDAAGPIYNCELFVPPTSVAVPGPVGFPFTVRCIYDPVWPADRWLDREKSNWDEWSRCMLLFAASRGLAKWLDGTLKLPETYPKATIVLFPTYRSLMPSSRSSENATAFLSWKNLTCSRRVLTSVSTSTPRLARRSTKSQPFTIKSPIAGSWNLIISNVYS